MDNRWIQRKLDEQGRSQAELAQMLGLQRDQVSKTISGVRRLQAAELPLVMRFFGLAHDELMGLLSTRPSVAPKRLPSARHLTVMGAVQAGVWIEAEAEDTGETIPVTPDPRYPDVPEYRHFALRVRGESMNLLLRDGDYALCVAITTLRGWHHDDIVVVERTRFDGSVKELTVKQVVKTAARLELWPRSTDPRFQAPIAIATRGDDAQTTDEQIEIKALVYGRYTRFPAG